MSQSVSNKYDSEFCGTLPIHLINVIQPYGILMVIEKKGLKIVQVSENVSAIFGISADEILNTRLNDYLSKDSLQTLDDKVGAALNENIPMVWNIMGKRYLVIGHFKDPVYLVEINIDSYEEFDGGSFVDVYQELKYAMSAIEGCRTVQEAVTTAARELKKSSGFDKVMIYQFDPNWNGHVLSEEMEEGMESYLGFTFPASDIPRQARELYLKNAYRFIPDRDYQPVKLRPVINPSTGAFLDMSDCNLRGVSAVHIEYLRNMNVAASMSTRIMKDGKLWGLIACHHRTPMKNSYKLCSIFELLSNVISSKISGVENEEYHLLDTFLQHHYTTLVEDTYRLNEVRASFFGKETPLLQAFDATGAVLSLEGQIDTVGTVPDRHQLDDILLWLHTRNPRKVYATDKLPEENDQVADSGPIASGMLAIPINPAKDEYILLFRPEVVQVINWGGDPGTRIRFDNDMKSYHPRHSFKQWQEQVRGISKPWNSGELQMAENLRNFLFEFLNASKF